MEVTNYLLSGTILHEVQVSNGYHFFVTTDLFKILSLSPFHLQPKSRPSFHMSNKAKHRLFRVMVGDETGYPVTFLGIISWAIIFWILAALTKIIWFTYKVGPYQFSLWNYTPPISKVIFSPRFVSYFRPFIGVISYNPTYKYIVGGLDLVPTFFRIPKAGRANKLPPYLEDHPS